MKATVPAIIGNIVLLFCSWSAHEAAVKRLKDKGTVEIIVYNSQEVIVRPTSHR